MTKPIGIGAIESSTGISWIDWVSILDGDNGRELDHASIAKIAHDKIVKTAGNKSAGWWAQSVAVAYEQYIGRRQPGQRSDGSFEVSVSRTVASDREMAFTIITEKLHTLDEVNGQAMGSSRASITPVRSYWRGELANGEKITLAVEAKAPAKSLATITAAKISSKAGSDKARVYWKKFLSQFML